MSSGIAVVTLVVSVVAWCPCASAAPADASDDAHACCAPRTGISAASQGCCDDHPQSPPATTPDLATPAGALDAAAPVHWSVMAAPLVRPTTAVTCPSPPLVLRI